MKPSHVILTFCVLLIAGVGFALAQTDTRPTVKVANLSCAELEQVGGAVKAALAHELEQGRTRKLANFRAQSLAIEAQQTGEMFKGVGGWVRKKYAEHGLTDASAPQNLIVLTAQEEQVVSALSTMAETLGGVFGEAGKWGTKAATKAAKRLGSLIAKEPLKGIGYAEISRPELGRLTVVLDKQEKVVWANVDLEDVKEEWKANYGWESERLHLYIPLMEEAPRPQLGDARVVLKARETDTGRLASKKDPSEGDKPRQERTQTERARSGRDADHGDFNVTGKDDHEPVEVPIEREPEEVPAPSISLKWEQATIGRPDHLAGDRTVYVDVAGPQGPQVHAIDTRSGKILATKNLQPGYEVLGVSAGAVYLGPFSQFKRTRRVGSILALDKATLTPLWSASFADQNMKRVFIVRQGIYYERGVRLAQEKGRWITETGRLAEKSGQPVWNRQLDKRDGLICIGGFGGDRINGEAQLRVSSSNMMRTGRGGAFSTDVFCLLEGLDLATGQTMWSRELRLPHTFFLGSFPVASNSCFVWVNHPRHFAHIAISETTEAAKQSSDGAYKLAACDLKTGRTKWESERIDELASCAHAWMAGASSEAVIVHGEVAHGHTPYRLWVGVNSRTGKVTWKKWAKAAPRGQRPGPLFAPDWTEVVGNCLLVAQGSTLIVLDASSGELFAREEKFPSDAGDRHVVYENMLVIGTDNGVTGYQVGEARKQRPSAPGGKVKPAPEPPTQPTSPAHRQGESDLQDRPESHATGGPGFAYPVKDDAGGNVTWRVTQAFGAYYAKMGGFHSGVDWSVPGSADLGKPVYAVANGSVAHVSQLRGNRGHLVAIEHDAPNENRPYTVPYWRKSESGREGSYASEGVSKVYSIYVHVTPASGITEGRTVERGQVIGAIADISPLSPHLHFEIRHPEASPSNDWSMVYDASGGLLSTLEKIFSRGKQQSSSGSKNTANWARVGGTVTGYYKDLQKMLDAGLRDPVSFIDANASPAKAQSGGPVPELGLAIAADPSGGAEESLQGVRIAQVKPESLAARAGLQENMVIVQVAGQQVRSVEDFRKALQGSTLAKGIPMLVRAGQQERFVLLKVR